jgi:hypothetical protein
MTDRIVDLLVENSPPGSGWLYLTAAEHWSLTSMILTVILTAIVVGCIAFVTEAFR